MKACERRGEKGRKGCEPQGQATRMATDRPSEPRHHAVVGAFCESMLQVPDEELSGGRIPLGKGRGKFEDDVGPRLLVGKVHFVPDVDAGVGKDQGGGGGCGGGWLVGWGKDFEFLRDERVRAGKVQGVDVRTGPFPGRVGREELELVGNLIPGFHEVEHGG